MTDAPTDPVETGKSLRRGWTTGACATAALKSALSALATGHFQDPVTITLPGGQTPAFALAHEATGEGWAEAGIIKDAGDDPDVTHGALVTVRVSQGPKGSGIHFLAGIGVGTVTRPGLKLAVGEPAINPVPRKMMQSVIAEFSCVQNYPGDFTVKISVPDGEELAKKTWNPRLGILGGLSILGTTGIVIPYSCSAWIHSIHRGIDVARAMGLTHIAGATGSTSEKAAMRHLALSEQAMIDMGDFVGGMLKYLRTHPMPRVTIAGGFAKISKLAQGALDLHSARTQVDPEFLATRLQLLGAPDRLIEAARAANLANEILALATAENIALGKDIAILAAEQSARILNRPETHLEVLITDQTGKIVGEAP